MARAVQCAARCHAATSPAEEMPAGSRAVRLAHALEVHSRRPACTAGRRRAETASRAQSRHAPVDEKKTRGEDGAAVASVPACSTRLSGLRPRRQAVHALAVQPRARRVVMKARGERSLWGKAHHRHQRAGSLEEAARQPLGVLGTSPDCLCVLLVSLRGAAVGKQDTKGGEGRRGRRGGHNMAHGQHRRRPGCPRALAPDGACC